MKGAKGSSKRPFYTALVLVAIVGAGLIGWAASRSSSAARRVVVPPQGNASQAQGYRMGSPDAPVQVMEFADYECPACANYALITEPDVRQRLIQPGLVSVQYFDFPLPMHQNTWFASNAAACADDQGKFWEMHDRLFAGQDEWNGEATNDPTKIMEGYARELGLDVNKFGQCMETRPHQQRIANNQAEAIRRHVNSTPTFFIGDRMVEGAISFDHFKALVDTILAEKKQAAPAAAPAAGQPATKR